MNIKSISQILVTKDKNSAEKYFSRLASIGVEIIYFPTIQIISRNENDKLKSLLTDANSFDYIIFTSANAVEVFSEMLQKFNINKVTAKITAVGPITAESCVKFGFSVDEIPKTFSSKGLIEYFSSLNIDGKKILIPGSSLSKEDLKIGLSELGAEVVYVPIYDVQHRDNSDAKNDLELIGSKRTDIFVFTSPSSFKYFLKLANIENNSSYFEGKIICAIGPTTEAAVKDFGLTVNIIPEMYSLAGVEEAIIKFYNINIV